MKKYDHLFVSGRITFLLDVAMGSSGKGTLEDDIVAESNVNFLCTTNSSNASHTVMRKDGRTAVFKTLPSGSFHHEKLDAVFIGAGAAIELEALMKEIEITGIPRSKVRISPLTPIIQDVDKDIEAGKRNFDGDLKETDGTVKTGTTASGSGAVRAKKVMRRKDLVLARDVDSIEDMIADVPCQILSLLYQGATGLCGVGQGFALSQGLQQFYPFTTSRNVTVSAALDDMFLPPAVVGNVVLNDRSYPIRIHDKKYKDKKSGEFIIWDEKLERDERGASDTYEVVTSYSGDFYEDSSEITWAQITELSGSPKPLMEATTLTKLPRRIATHSKKNLHEAIISNMPPEPAKVFVAVSFINYVDWEMYGKNGEDTRTGEAGILTDKVKSFLESEIYPVTTSFSEDRVSVLSLNTSPYSEDKILLKPD